MKRIVVLGGKGMAGHMLLQWLTSRNCEVIATQRAGKTSRRYINLDLRNEKRLERFLRRVKPEVVINAAGLLNDSARTKMREAIEINSLLPHRLADYGDEMGFRLIHISTDCVFSGISGPYNESRIRDGTTAYSKSKSLGEVDRARHLTIRTSIIGPELKEDGIGLLHWFLNEEGPVHGYCRMLWNGVTTLELAKFIEWSLHHPLEGLVHLTGRSKLSKQELLKHMNKAFRKKVEIIPCGKLHHDKCLLNTREDCRYRSPDYPDMLKELAGWMSTHREQYKHYPFLSQKKG